jgi:tetratricopeptide (TPR) repeat protein
MFGFGDSRYKEEARVTVETCISCARQMDGLFLIDSAELQKIGETVPGFQTEMWVKLLASAQLTHNLMVIMMLVRAGAVKTSWKEFQKTAVYVDQYVNAHPFFGKRLSDLMIELTNQIYTPQTQNAFPRYGWGRWVINLSKRENTGQPSDLNELLTFDETKLADKIDHQITYAMMAECEPIYSVCIKPSSLPVRKTAETLFENSKAKAEKGDAHSQYLLGCYYHIGEGVPKDYAEAAKWLRKAAEQGHAAAQFSLGGVCYANGLGVPKDYAEMVKWWRKAAEQGHATAQRGLGICYSNGQGVQQDYVEAVKWYRKAAEQGEADAQINMGNCYSEGKGVPQDYVQAYKWYNLASAQKNKDAAACRDAFAALMTPDQIAEAQKLSTEFQPRKESAFTNSN